jgi:hypothetical protein
MEKTSKPPKSLSAPISAHQLPTTVKQSKRVCQSSPSGSSLQLLQPQRYKLVKFRVAPVEFGTDLRSTRVPTSLFFPALYCYAPPLFITPVRDINEAEGTCDAFSYVVTRRSRSPSFSTLLTHRFQRHAVLEICELSSQTLATPTSVSGIVKYSSDFVADNITNSRLEA